MEVQAGIEVLKSGGNAADAIAVMQFMLGVVQPQSTGIGGGCFVLLYNRCQLYLHRRHLRALGLRRGSAQDFE
jgi:gamma-glutamyltranspeptidase